MQQNYLPCKVISLPGILVQVSFRSSQLHVQKSLHVHPTWDALLILGVVVFGNRTFKQALEILGNYFNFKAKVQIRICGQ